MYLIAVLITCHNRIEKTLQCLSSLYSQNEINSKYLVESFLVDDGSTDGTSEKVISNFPDINIIKADGNLFWNRGMLLAWKHASSKRKYDFYLWLNDDTFLFENAVSDLLRFSDVNSIICGTTISSITSKPTYGGFKLGHLIIPNNDIQHAEYINGNCVLIPNLVFTKIGYLDPFFHHALGDFDYSLRAVKLGVKLLICPNYVGFCENHLDEPQWLLKNNSFSTRLKYLYKPNSGCNPFQYFRFDLRHYGIISALFHFFTIHLRCIYPYLWRYKHFL